MSSRHWSEVVRGVEADDAVEVREQAEAVLRETTQFYVALDEGGVVRGWNLAASRIFGYGAEQALGRLLEDLIIPPPHRRSHRRGIEEFVRTGTGRGIDAPVEVQAVRADGSEVPVELTIWAQATPAGYLFHALGSDLSERRTHERVLRLLAEHRRRLLAVNGPDEVYGLLVETLRRATGVDGAWLYVPDGASPPSARLAAESLQGAAPGPAVVGWAAGPDLIAGVHAHLRRLVSCRSRCPEQQSEAQVTIAVEPVVSGEEIVGVLAVACRTAQERLATTTLDLLELLAAEAGLVLQRLALQEQLEAAARTDSLTGLPNRRAFDEALRSGLSRAQREEEELSLVLVDLDCFKAYNDTNGHPAGDDLLCRVTAAWRGVVRAPDLLARIGGDEFALVLPGTDESAAEIAVARLLASTPQGVSLSTGIGALVADDDVRALLQRADQALYRNKKARR